MSPIKSKLMSPMKSKLMDGGPLTGAPLNRGSSVDGSEDSGHASSDDQSCQEGNRSACHWRLVSSSADPIL